MLPSPNLIFVKFNMATTKNRWHSKEGEGSIVFGVSAGSSHKGRKSKCIRFVPPR
jgi:hypothetical protein